MKPKSTPNVSHPTKFVFLGPFAIILLLLTTINLNAQIQSKKADDFINSIGLCTHINYSGVYTNNTNTKTQLLNLGIKHIRDGLDNNFVSAKELADNGIKITGVLQGDFGLANQTPAFWLQKVKNDNAMYAFEAFEGPNEADLPMMNFQYKGQGWPLGVKAFQIDLYNTVKNDATISNRPVLGPSIGSGTKDTWANSMGDISAYVDYGNFHYYKAWGESYSGGYPGWDLQSIINIHKTMFGAKPFMSTEGGNNTAINSDGGISEVVNSKYTLRYFMEYWRLGVVRTFKYELFDEGTSLTNGEQKFGLIENDGTTIKPAGSAVKNMIALLNEPSPSTIFNPGTLNFTITNADSYTHYNLLQKSTGKYYLILWNDAGSWNANNKTEIANNDPLTITFNQPIADAKLYAPCTDGTTMVNTITNPTSINVTIPNHPYIYEITTGTAANVSVTGVSLNPTSASVAVGATVQLTKTISPTNATNANVSWSSGNTSVATVDANGLVTGTVIGSATITATTIDGAKTAISAINVTSLSGGSWTIVDDADAGWAWNGFTVDPCSNCYNGTAHSTNVKNKTAQYTFTGTNVEAYCGTWSGAGSVKIYIDGVLRGTYNQNITPYAGQQKFVSIGGLSNSAHTIRFLSTSSSWVGIDYIRFAVNPPAGTLLAKSTSILNTDNEERKYAIGVYPNPATNFVIIDFSSGLNSVPAYVEILDLSGRLMYNSGRVSHISTLQLNVSQYQKGVYIIKITNGNNMVAKKLIIE